MARLEVRAPLLRPVVPPGVADEQDVLVVQLHLGLGLGGLGQEILIAVGPGRGRALAQHQQALGHRPAGLGGQAVVQEHELRPQHQARGLGVADAVGDLRGLEPVVDGHHPHPQLGGGVVDLQVLGAVQGQHRQLVALYEAQTTQGVGQAVHPGVELTVGPGAVLADDGRLVRVTLGAARQGPAHEHDVFSVWSKARFGGRRRARPGGSRRGGRSGGRPRAGGSRSPG